MTGVQTCALPICEWHNHHPTRNSLNRLLDPDGRLPTAQSRLFLNFRFRRSVSARMQIERGRPAQLGTGSRRAGEGGRLQLRTVSQRLLPNQCYNCLFFESPAARRPTRPAQESECLHVQYTSQVFAVQRCSCRWNRWWRLSPRCATADSHSSTGSYTRHHSRCRWPACPDSEDEIWQRRNQPPGARR